MKQVPSGDLIGKVVSTPGMTFLDDHNHIVLRRSRPRGTTLLTYCTACRNFRSLSAYTGLQVVRAATKNEMDEATQYLKDHPK